MSFASASRTRAYVEERKLDWTALIDERRELYRAYGMDRAHVWDVWGPATLRAYARELLRGNRLQPAREDVRQRGGDVLVDPNGIVRLHFVGKGPAERPTIDDLLRIRWGSAAAGHET